MNDTPAYAASTKQVVTRLRRVSDQIRRVQRMAHEDTVDIKVNEASAAIARLVRS